VGCSKNAITGRKQLSLVSENQLQQEAVTKYQSFLSKNKVVSNSSNKDAEMVKRVGSSISKVITSYYTNQGKGDLLKGYNWEFNLIDNKEVNAWCMKGGKVVVYTGLLPVAQNEAALAVVLGHEIAYAIAAHGNERMSQGMLAQGLGTIGDILTSNNPKVNNIFNNTFGLGDRLGYYSLIVVSKSMMPIVLEYPL